MNQPKKRYPNCVPNYLHDEETVGPMERTIGLQLRHGNYEGARRALATAIKSLTEEATAKLVTELTVQELFDASRKVFSDKERHLLERAANMLETQLRIKTVRRLVEASWDDVKTMAQSGVSTCKTVQRALHQVGLIWPIERITDRPIGLMVDRETALRFQAKGMTTMGQIEKE